MKPKDAETGWPKALTLVACLLAACGRGEPDEVQAQTNAKEPSQQTLRVDPSLIDSGRIELARVQGAALAGSWAVPGEVVSAADGEAEVGALVSGRVRTLQVVEGDVVKKGDTLAVLDSLEIGDARSALLRAESEKSLARRRLERLETLSTQGATTQAVLDEAESAVAQADAVRVAAGTKLRTLGSSGGSGSEFVLRAPIEGVVVERRAVIGAPVRPDESLFRIVAPGKILVLARYPEVATELPRKGTEVLFVSRAGGSAEPCKARVEAGLGVVDPRTRTALVRLLPLPGCPGLRPGAYVDVLGPVTNPGGDPKGTETSLVVPSSAVLDVRGVPTVFVALPEKGLFSPQKVAVRRSSGDFSILEAGLESEHPLRAGSQVVTRGAILLKGEMLRDLLGGE